MIFFLWPETSGRTLEELAFREFFLLLPLSHIFPDHPQEMHVVLTLPPYSPRSVRGPRAGAPDDGGGGEGDPPRGHGEAGCCAWGWRLTVSVLDIAGNLAAEKRLRGTIWLWKVCLSWI